MFAVALDFWRARNPGLSRVSMTDTTCVMKIHQTITTKIVVSLSLSSAGGFDAHKVKKSSTSIMFKDLLNASDSQKKLNALTFWTHRENC